MMTTDINTNQYSTKIFSNRFDEFQTKATKFKEITGREIVDEKDSNGNFIHMLHPESTQRLSFMGEFFRVGFNSEGGFIVSLENLARKYTELREELMERHDDNQDELYQQLGELNQTFESSLRSMILLPLQSPSTNKIISSNMSKSVHESMKRDNQEHENIKSIMHTLQQNMVRHLDNFFETFINNILNEDFDTAFANGIEKLSKGESKSLSDMSFIDTITIRDILLQGHYKKDESHNDREVFIFNRPINSLRAVVNDIRISETMRKEIADMMGFTWRSVFENNT